MGQGLNVDRVNYVNIALMLVSAAVAVAFPFGLFLFSYAVLGPLHYLTEISWLHDRKYFSKGRYDHVILGLICILIVLPVLGAAVPHRMTILLIYSAFALAGIFAFTPSWRMRATLTVYAMVFSPIVASQGLLIVVVGVLLPSIVHVFVFTGMFILAGTLKQKSASGALSFGMFLGLAAGLLLWHPAFAQHPMPGGYIRSAYGELSSSAPDKFLGVNYVLLKLLSPSTFPTAGTAYEGVNAYLYGHPMARSVMAFIAFAYTYHYLNWFSKTSVIRWHKVSKTRLTTVLVIWFASLGLYAADYTLGARWLYMLSFLHVILELPLNHVTFRGIVTTLRGPPAAASTGHNPA